MNVAFITSGYPPVSPGGAGLSSKLIVNALEEQGIDVDVYAIIGDHSGITKLDKNVWSLSRGDHYPLPKTISENISAYRNLPSLSSYDLTHVYNVRHIPSCIIKSESPIVATFNNHMWSSIDPINHLRDGFKKCGIKQHFHYSGTSGYTGTKRVLRLGIHYLGKSLAQNADQITVQTLGMKKALYKNGYNRSKITVIPNILDQRFDVEPKNENIILFAGRLTEQKGPQVLLKAYKQLSETVREDWKLNMYGDGELKESLEEYISRNNLQNATISYCPYEQLPNVYSKAGVLVHPSIYTEPFSRCWLEAMASETPIICSDNPSSKSVLNSFAEFYDPFNPNELANSLETIITKPTKREQMSAVGYRNTKKYLPGKIAKAYMSLYKRTVD